MVAEVMLLLLGDLGCARLSRKASSSQPFTKRPYFDDVKLRRNKESAGQCLAADGR
jgi:hypothetical protein